MTYKTDQQVSRYLKKILESKGFQQGDIYVSMLEYLVKAYQEGSVVKETVLELELFNSNGQSQSYEGKVRVYMYNLRKKLDEYYRTEGKQDELIFKIEKGQYNLSIDSKSQSGGNPWKLVMLIFLGVVVVGLFLIFFKSGQSAPKLWQSFMKPGVQNICYVGDHYTLWAKMKSGLNASIHLEGVTSESEFDQLPDSLKPDGIVFEKQNYSFVTKMGPITASKLTRWFDEFDRDLEVSMESDFVEDDMLDHNIIYVGPYKTLVGLSQLFLKDSKVFGFDGRAILDLEKGQSVPDRTVKDIWSESVMVSYAPLSDNDNSILFFAANNDIGVMAAVANFTNKDWLEEFYQNIPEDNAYFNALFEVKGLGRTNLRCELVKLEIIGQD
ncbi:hypothetical protein [Marinoscillum sp. MHG1-6]|uniref:hypothetical protein n=1 Tax=Marinoscillum sp. MHG1-6 TaxID=2959627 RepID=UPI002157F4B8|nr:hypothetical protein [Marinoscillum sp. MHG1-6]